MKTLHITSAVLGILLSAPVMTYPAASVSAPTVDRAHPHDKANFAYAKALAPLWATPAAGATSPAHETDGLSRNPDDCNFGCIDNN
ncbi:MAG TPA: hypothetical protein VFE60_09970 [Roseiarcus sp.]|nr:hypothetical protein [Roseiarcus sp.]